MSKTEKIILLSGFVAIGYFIYKKYDQKSKDLKATEYYYQLKQEIEK